MASNEYIAITDIDQHNFKQIPDASKTKYVDDVNDWYEAYASTKNVLVADIEFPINILVKEFIVSKLLMNYASDNINGASTNLSAAGLYQNIYVMAKDEYNQASPRINSSAIQGYVNSSSSTVVFGKRTR